MHSPNLGKLYDDMVVLENAKHYENHRSNNFDELFQVFSTSVVDSFVHTKLTKYSSSKTRKIHSSESSHAHAKCLENCFASNSLSAPAQE